MSTYNKTPTPEQIIQNLHDFNRKERDHLIKFALCGEKPPKPAISAHLWRLVRLEKGAKRPLPRNMFLGMDYHLNWLYAALMVDRSSKVKKIGDLSNKWKAPGNEREFDEVVRPIQPNQQDVDLLLVYYKKPKQIHIVLIEAKLTSGWDSAQFASKIARINAIKVEAENRLGRSVEQSWRFYLASPANEGPSLEQFSEENVQALPDWVAPQTNGKKKLRYIQYGPETLYQVKRRSAKQPGIWEVVAMQLR